jgi:peptidoglycan/LPS O-acetylase OafA/YrhL
MPDQAMQPTKVSQSATHTRANNFSILRILFATLVILSHSTELIDGNRSREILTRLFGTISFGVLAVDGFFVVSGYLITKSYLSSKPMSYLFKRILRIYPGFIVAFFVSIVLCNYFSAHSFSMPKMEVFDNVLNLVFLISPGIKTAYPGSFFPISNASMWTISYEFHCYLMIMLLGFVGLFKRTKTLLALTILAVLAYLIHPENYALGDSISAISVSAGFGAQIIHKIKAITLELPIEDLRFLAVFLVGACFYIFRDVILYRTAFAASAAILLSGCLFSNHLAEPGLAVFGGYIIFWFALDVKALSISKFLNKTDLSYGIYLYAWPVQKVLISLMPHITPITLFFATLILCLIVAYFSWILIEKPFLNLKVFHFPRKAERTPLVESA